MPKKIPLRQCLGCREMKPKRELIRAVRSPEGEISLDFKGRKPGRGAYVCPNADCLKKARRSKALERAFGAPIPDEVWQALEREMQEAPPVTAEGES
ncbi:MAG: YlxR family protein [Eubacteriales bacterium]|nr:YlxR family protein [Eubacteriales bacterium]